MKSLVLGLVLIFLGSVAHADAAHLSFANGTIRANYTWTKGPQSPAESILGIQWMDGVNGTLAEPPGTFVVDLFMPAMGHGSAPTQIQRTIDASGNPYLGTYTVSNMYFVMAGKWQVNVTLNFPNGTKETQTIDVDVPGAMSGGGHHH